MRVYSTVLVHQIWQWFVAKGQRVWLLTFLDSLYSSVLLSLWRLNAFRRRFKVNLWNWFHKQWWWNSNLFLALSHCEPSFKFWLLQLVLHIMILKILLREWQRIMRVHRSLKILYISLSPVIIQMLILSAPCEWSWFKYFLFSLNRWWYWVCPIGIKMCSSHF